MSSEGGILREYFSFDEERFQTSTEDEPLCVRIYITECACGTLLFFVSACIRDLMAAPAHLFIFFLFEGPYDSVHVNTPFDQHI